MYSIVCNICGESGFINYYQMSKHRRKEHYLIMENNTTKNDKGDSTD